MAPMGWTQPLCTACWLDLMGEWDGDTLVSLRTPVVVKHDDEPWEGRLVRCCTCGRATTSGIFTRLDPDTVAYPRGDLA